MVFPKTTPDQYTLVSSAHHDTVYGDYQDVSSAKVVDIDVQLMASIRDHHPSMTVTAVPAAYADLAGYAAAGYARAELDTSEDSMLRWRFYRPASVRGGPGYLADAYFFARYKYHWNKAEFIVYSVREGFNGIINYILYPPDDDETPLSHSKITDALLQAIGDVQFKVEGTILVFDWYWTRSRALYEQVQKTSWDDVILDKKFKKSLTKTVVGFFDNEQSYKNLGVPWKRGVLCHGPPGNGKTLTIKALMHSLSVRKDPVVCLYVKALLYTSDIGTVFSLARQVAPCLLILEDIDTLVTESMRSYFFNEVDGLENNHGIMIVATTNHLDRLDGGLTKRPSRFDRKYAFLNPERDQRILYCDYWRRKLEHNKNVEFPEKLSPAIADITEDFTFAYLKEAFVASLLALARQGEDDDGDGDEDEGESVEKVNSLERPGLDAHSLSLKDDSDIADLPLWIQIQKEVKILREDMNTTANAQVSGRAQGPAPAPAPAPAPFMPDGLFGGDPTLQSGSAVEERVVNLRSEFNLNAAYRKTMPDSEQDNFGQFGDRGKKSISKLLPKWNAFTAEQ